MEHSNVFVGKFENLVGEIMMQHHVPCYRVESAMEHRKHADGRISVIPVIRIISYFEDTAGKAAAILADEFELTAVQSANPSESGLNGFAAQQVVYLAALKPNRQELTEYKKWGTERFEIQISSILQAAWRGIERELTKGGSTVVPDEIKRDFQRIGALLETVDIEFSRITNHITTKRGTLGPGHWTEPAYAHAGVNDFTTASSTVVANGSFDTFDSLALEAEKINKAATVNNIPAGISFDVAFSQAAEPKVVKTEPKAEHISADTEKAGINISINGLLEHTAEISAEEAGVYGAIPSTSDGYAQMTDVSLKEYIKNSKLLREIDQMIAERAGAKVNDEIDIEGDVERLKFLRVFTLKQLHEVLSDNKNDIVAFAEKWIGKDNGGSFDSGISLFYLEYLIVGKKNDPTFAVEYVLKFISDNDYSARYIIPTYNSIRQAETASPFSSLNIK
jgi:hypothetical protein